MMLKFCQSCGKKTKAKRDSGRGNHCPACKRKAAPARSKRRSKRKAVINLNGLSRTQIRRLFGVTHMPID